MFRRLSLSLAVTLSLVPGAANAFCSYHGELYAKTTLQQEYRDARWVVRAKVISASDWERADERGTVYRMELVDSFKGNLPQRFLYSTERNSGGFYLDRGSKTDVGGEYLLFLVPNPRPSVGPPSIRHALWVNYSCGQSRAWREVAREKKATLAALSPRR